ncbi:MAG: hypothetical protein RRY41_02000 [Burkholderiaceae bacterium]
MARFQSSSLSCAPAPVNSTISAARRARWIAGGALNLFALVLVVSQVWPGVSA